MNINVSKRRFFRLSPLVALTFSLLVSLTLNVGLLCIVCVGFVYSLEYKLYISQRAENQRNKERNVGFVYSLQSFFVSPFIYV